MSGSTTSFTVRRIDDDAEFELLRVYRRPEDKLADVVSPDGREVYTTDEVNFFFSDEPTRPIAMAAFARGHRRTGSVAFRASNPSSGRNWSSTA